MSVLAALADMGAVLAALFADLVAVPVVSNLVGII